MTLQVTFDQFAETVKRLLNQQEAYVSQHAMGTLVTAAKPEKTVVVAALVSQSPEAVTAMLKERGMSVFDGTWLTPEEVLAPAAGLAQTYVAAVSYRSGAEKAGVWVDAYPALPTQVTVLKTMYEEFRQTGEVDDVAFEEFVQLANPNVVIVTPTELESFLRQKEEC
ncbi:MAG: hypothetical protein ACHQ50_10525 [Fimbriimonadales bacterium]